MAEPESPLVKLAGAIGGASAGIFFLAAFFGGHDLWPAAVAVIALAAMGFGFAYLITKPH